MEDDMNKRPSKDSRSGLYLLEKALAEYAETREVATVRCDECNQLLEIVPLGESALSVNCACGKFKDVLRGVIF